MTIEATKTFSLTVNIICLIFISLLAVIYFKKGKIDNVENKIYSFLLKINIISLIIELIFFLLFQNNIEGIFLEVSERLYYFSTTLYLFVIAIYNRTLWANKSTNQSNESNSKSRKIVISSIILLGAIIAILPITRIYDDGTLVGSTGVAPASMFIFCCIVHLYNIITLTAKRKIIDRKKVIPMYLFFLLMLVQLVVTGMGLNVFLTTLNISMVSFLMYHTIENPDIKMLEEVSLAKEQAEKANTAKSEFLSNMSHEIRTPLNAIVGFSEMLKEDNIPKESKEKVDDIITASQNLLEIVNGILDISKIEANKLEIIKKEYEPAAMLQELISLTKARIGDKGLDFKVNIDQTIPKVLYGDDSRIKQIILNVLTNAVKYTKEGYIIFTVSSIIKDNVCRLIISVEDSGIGIKQENLNKLFTKFERLDVEKQLTIEGTGLGLAITKKLLDLMNGTIIVQSIYGKGSKFTISLDQRIVSMDIPLEKKPAEVESTIIDANGVKVLIVDDNEMNIKVATTLLKKYHFNIDSCTSGRACISKIEENNNYDLILLDDMMPKLSGKETLLKLKEIPNFNIPVIALTANAITGMKEEYINFGFNDYLSKPIERKELERIIKTTIKKDNQKQINSNTSVSTTSIITEKLEKTETNILVIDENIYTCKILESALNDFNVKASNVTTIKEAVSSILEKDYSLIFVDKELKDKSYKDVIKELQSIDGFKSPVILMTKDIEDKKEIDEIKKIGYSGYITKPIDNIEVEKIYKTIVK